MEDFTNTFQRSCDHWSESSRKEMEDFYTLAAVDYHYLAEAINWKTWLENRQKETGPSPLKLLDVACGSGKFPKALTSHADVARASIKPVDYSLLDPSSFSISEARKALTFPFNLSSEYEMKLQDFECKPGSFDIVWATHALYAIPYNELESSLKRMVHAILKVGETKKGGAGFIAHANTKSHYLKFFNLYLSGFRGGIGIPYSSSEEIIKILAKLGVNIKVKEISYLNTAPHSKDPQVEKYLQRCLFDDTISLKEMLSNPSTGPYLKACCKKGIWEFEQKVTMIFFNTSLGPVSEK